MQNDRLAVARETDIELDPTAIERLCLTKSSQRVFGRLCSSTAMPNDPRKNNFRMRRLQGKQRRRPGCRVSH